MREFGLTFRSDLALAIRKGLKTQTRRPVDPQPDEDGLVKLKGELIWHDTDGREYLPPLRAGDRIFVKEDHKLFGHKEENGTVKVMYREGEVREVDCYPVFEFHGIGSHLPWTDARHMPKWAARTWLEVVKDSIAQRIQEISEADIIAEGCPKEYLLGINWFRPLWQSLYPGSWERNEWIWKHEFKVVENMGRPA